MAEVAMRGGPRCAVTDAERAAIRAELLGPARAGGYRAVAEHVGRSVVTIRKEAQKLIDTGEMLPRLLGRPGERRVIDCPICGRELGLPPHQPHTRMTAQEMWLVRRMRGIGAPLKMIGRVLGGGLTKTGIAGMVKRANA